MNLKNEMVAGGAALVTLAGVALAGYQYRNRHKAYHRDFDMEKVEELTGKIADIKFTGKDNSESKGMELVLQSDEKKIAVHLGPVWYMNMQREKLEKGDVITVKGSRVSMNHRPVMIAEELKLGNKVLKLRDPNGHPHWMAWEHLS